MPQNNPVIEHLRSMAESAFSHLREQIKEVTDVQSWWRPEIASEADYLHSTGSIMGIVLHVASCKIMYAEYAFGPARYTWRDMVEAAREREPRMEACRAWLDEAQRIWMESWKELRDADLGSSRPTNWGEHKPAEWIINTMIGHDSYHSGQIALLKSMLPPNPEQAYQPESDDWEKFLCQQGMK